MPLVGAITGDEESSLARVVLDTAAPVTLLMEQRTRVFRDAKLEVRALPGRVPVHHPGRALIVRAAQPAGELGR